MADMKTLTLGGKTFNLVDVEARAKAIPTVQVGGDTLTWDGNTEGKENVQKMTFKVSDVVPTIDCFSNGFSITLSNGANADCPANWAVENYNGLDGTIALVLGHNTEEEQTVALIVSKAATSELGISAGTYFLHMGEFGVDVYLTSLTIPGFVFGSPKIDPAYLYQPDWNQNDETAADFIKNRLFGGRKPTWDDIGSQEVVFAEGENLTFTAEGAMLSPNYMPVIGTFVDVVFDGVTYSCEVRSFQDLPFVGNVDVGLPGLPGFEPSDEPFFVLFVSEAGAAAIVTDISQPHSISISGIAKVKIPVEYAQSYTKYYVPQQNEQIYLYQDFGETIKVTRDELQAAVRKGTIVLSLAESEYYFPTAIKPYYGDTYGAVVALDEGHEIMLYTAEYTGT